MDKSTPSDKTINNNDISNAKKIDIPKKPLKPPKLEDKPLDEFITNYFIPDLKKSIIEKGSNVNEIKLIHGNRPVVGGKCWMVFCELEDERKFWLCFNNDIITSSKTIILAESLEYFSSTDI